MDSKVERMQEKACQLAYEIESMSEEQFKTFLMNMEDFIFSLQATNESISKINIEAFVGV